MAEEMIKIHEFNFYVPQSPNILHVLTYPHKISYYKYKENLVRMEDIKMLADKYTGKGPPGRPRLRL